MDNVKAAIASAVRTAVGKNLLSWKYEATALSNLETQVKVWPTETGPPRYFIVQVRELP